jgi:hypothetical protein
MSPLALHKAQAKRQHEGMWKSKKFHTDRTLAGKPKCKQHFFAGETANPEGLRLSSAFARRSDP